VKLEGRARYRAGANLENAPSQFNLLLHLTGFSVGKLKKVLCRKTFYGERERVFGRERAHVGKLKKKYETRFAHIIRPLKKCARPSFLIQILISTGMERQEAAAVAAAARCCWINHCQQTE
jgi:hypothetical protein